MIPKVIHYCWFGGKPLPKDALEYIESWKKYLPDYEIKRWDESNFDVNSIPYTKEAYQAGKYAFVSDYASLSVLSVRSTYTVSLSRRRSFGLSRSHRSRRCSQSPSVV